MPLAATVKEAGCPAETVVGMGWVVTTGTVPTVRLEALLVTVPAVLLTLQRNWSPLMARVLVTRKSAVVVPL